MGARNLVPQRFGDLRYPTLAWTDCQGALTKASRVLCPSLGRAGANAGCSAEHPSGLTTGDIMLAAIRVTCSLLKFRIGVAFAASALAGMAAAKGPAISVAQASALALAVLGASGAAGAFNHYYERDLDREMRRTRSRPFASGAFQPSLWWPISFLALLVASLALAATANGLVSSLLGFLG